MALTILVVEDHAPFRRAICEVLQRRAEFQTWEAADGLEGIRKAEALQPDVILLDINLPEMNGFEVARRLPRLAPRARVLFMSQESAPDIIREALSLGATGYVHKASAGADLLPAIDAALAGRRFVSRGLAFSEPAGAPAPRRHEILFCQDDAGIVAGLARFVADALNAGDAAIALLTEPHRARFLQELRRLEVDVDGAVSRGTWLSFAAEVAPKPARILEAIGSVRTAAVKAGKGEPRVTMCGERAGLLWVAGRTAEAIELEQLCDQLAPDVDLLCAYPVPYTEHDPALARICGVHTTVSVG